MEPLVVRDVLTIVVGWLIFGIVRMLHVLSGAAAGPTPDRRTADVGVAPQIAPVVMAAPSTHRLRLIPHSSRGSALVK